MKNISLACILFANALFFACDNKNDKGLNTNDSPSDTSMVDTTTTFEKQNYGNGNTETSGNSGH